MLRELGSRTQKTFASIRNDGSNPLLIVNRFRRDAIPAETLALLLRDARCLEKNWHPNIARVRHVEIIDDTLFIASELIEGITLEDLLTLDPAAPLPEDLVARIFLDVLSGLQALHALRDGMNAPLFAFHGELSPANVVIGRDGVARLINTLRPRPLTVAATSEAVRYAPPEVLAAEEAQDARVDVYAVGVMLWEVLAGRALYTEKSPARIAQRQREDEVPRPEGALADVAMRALAFDPFLRFQTTQHMAASLRTAVPTLATGSTLAQVVMGLAGERIRMRRLELHPGASGQRPALKLEDQTIVAPPAPVPVPAAPASSPPKRSSSPMPGRIRKFHSRELRVEPVQAPPPDAPEARIISTIAPIPRMWDDEVPHEDATLIAPPEMIEAGRWIEEKAFESGLRPQGSPYAEEESELLASLPLPHTFQLQIPTPAPFPASAMTGPTATLPMGNAPPLPRPRPPKPAPVFPFEPFMVLGTPQQSTGISARAGLIIAAIVAIALVIVIGGAIVIARTF